MKLKTGTGFSKKFILTVAGIYSSLIIISAVILNWALGSTIETASGMMLYDNAKYSSRMLEMVTNSARDRQFKDISEFSAYLKSSCGEISGILGLNLYKRTEDENFFRVLDVIKINPAYSPGITPGLTVKPKKGLAGMKESLTRRNFDPLVYTDGIIRWQNIYQPFNLGSSLILIQGVLSPGETESRIDALNRSHRIYKIIIFIISTIIAAGVVSATYLFYQNYSFIMRGIASHLDTAAGGNYNIRIRSSDDEELNLIADSFNSLIEEIKDHKIRSEEKESLIQNLNEHSDSCFRDGVTCMKENNPEKAIPLFRVVTLIKPESYSSFFNLGVAYARTREYNLSLEMFDRALEINPSHELSSSYREKILNLISKNA